MRVRADCSGDRALERRSRERQHDKDDENCPQCQKKPLTDLNAPHLALLEFLQEGNRAELDSSQLAEV